MKKLVFLLAALFTLSLTALASDDKPIAVEKMPQKAQQFIRQHFAGKSVALAKVESELLNKSYDVIFTNGDKVEFDKSGNWTKLDCEYSEVPAAVVPEGIRQYVAKQYPDARILKIEKERKGYEVELSNGWDIKFDRSLNVREIDR